MLAANAAIEANRIHFHPSSERLMCRPSATTSRSLSGSSLKHRDVLEQRRDRQRVEPQRRTSGSCPHADTCAPVPSIAPAEARESKTAKSTFTAAPITEPCFHQAPTVKRLARPGRTQRRGSGSEAWTPTAKRVGLAPAWPKKKVSSREGR